MSKKDKRRHLSVVGGDAPWGAYDDDILYGPGYGKAFVGSGKVVGHVGARCYHSHKPVEIEPGCIIHGGSCCTPAVKDADVYVGFDRGMEITDRSLPWTEGVEFLYPIRDMGAPKNPDSFKKLIEWIADQMRTGKKVHMGCIGGHGRTGTVMAALVKHMTGNEDAITWVRQHYCKKAVETTEQVKFLVAHFGVKSVNAMKNFCSYKTSTTGSKQSSIGFHQPKSLIGNNPKVYEPMMQRFTLFTA